MGFLKNARPLSIVGFVAAVMVGLLAGSELAYADACQWTGAGDDNKWSNAANWDCSGKARRPRHFDSLMFQGPAAQPANVNDLDPGLIVNVILISGVGAAPDREGWKITGNPVTVRRSVVVSSPPDAAGDGPSFQVPITLGGAVAVLNNFAGAEGFAPFVLESIDLDGWSLDFIAGAPITVSDSISGLAGAAGVQKHGASFLTLNDNSYKGITLVVEGTLCANTKSALGAGGRLNETLVLPGALLLLSEGVVVDERIVSAFP
jgi:hypothetical protein